MSRLELLRAFKRANGGLFSALSPPSHFSTRTFGVIKSNGGFKRGTFRSLSASSCKGISTTPSKNISRTSFHNLRSSSPASVSSSSPARVSSSSSQHYDVLTKTLTSKANDELIRCTIFDKHGNMIHHGKDIRRLEFMKLHNLVARDFRKINRHQALVVPSIVTRTEGILLNLLNIRALIKHDMVVIFDTVHTFGSINESHSHGQFLKDMSERLKGEETIHPSNLQEQSPSNRTSERLTDDLPYEFRALESILIHVISNLTTEMKVHITVLQNILAGLEDSIERVKLRYLLIQSKKITQFHQKASLVRNLLDDLLEQDDELNALYLSDIHAGSPRSGTNHTEVELLLESYYKTSDEIVQTVENLKSQIKTTEEIINIVLDSNRNELMLLGLKFSTGLLSMGAVLYVGALYGMNLENFIEEQNGGFELVVVVSLGFLCALLAVSVRLLKRLQRITMMGVERRH
jgi:magnesium transporter